MPQIFPSISKAEQKVTSFEEATLNVLFQFSILKCPFALRCCRASRPPITHQSLPRDHRACLEPSPNLLPATVSCCPAFILFCVHVTCWKINNNKKRQPEETNENTYTVGAGGGWVNGRPTNTRVTLLNVC